MLIKKSRQLIKINCRLFLTYVLTDFISNKFPIDIPSRRRRRL